jgi:hypothetical protein
MIFDGPTENNMHAFGKDVREGAHIHLFLDCEAQKFVVQHEE